MSRSQSFSVTESGLPSRRSFLAGSVGLAGSGILALSGCTRFVTVILPVISVLVGPAVSDLWNLLKKYFNQNYSPGVFRHKEPGEEPDASIFQTKDFG